MERPRFFVSKENKSGEIINILDNEFVHLSSVLRLKVGDKIDICLNDGAVILCELVEIEKRCAHAKIISVDTPVRRSAKITLFLALTKAERMDWAVQKCTELGVDEIVPFVSEFCTVKDKGTKTDRLNRVAFAASKQSGRVVLPEISQNLTLKEVLERLKGFPQVVLAYENSTASAQEILSKFSSTQDTALIIGSEGGFSEREVQDFINASAQVISLGDTILRAETACVALLSAINYQFDFWKRK